MPTPAYNAMGTPDGGNVAEVEVIKLAAKGEPVKDEK